MVPKVVPEKSPIATRTAPRIAKQMERHDHSDPADRQTDGSNRQPQYDGRRKYDPQSKTEVPVAPPVRFGRHHVPHC